MPILRQQRRRLARVAAFFMPASAHQAAIPPNSRAYAARMACLCRQSFVGLPEKRRRLDTSVA